MATSRRASGGRLPKRALLFLPAALLLAPLAGCGGLRLGLGGGPSSTDVHTVLLVRDGCATFVARTLRGGFVVAAADGAGGTYAPVVGDVLAGPAREGRSVFEVYPPGAETAGDPDAPPADNVPLDLQAIGLDLADARARLDAACGPPRPPSAPR